MVAMAAGLATTGKIPFANTFAAFMVLRAGDPVRSLIAYTKLNVKLAGTYAGLSDSYDGASHHAIADIAFMRSLPNMTVISVCDPVEAELATRAAAEFVGPVYLRLSRAEAPVVFDKATYDFKIGKGVTVVDGADLTIVATGYMLVKALEAAKILAAQGHQCARREYPHDQADRPRVAGQMRARDRCDRHGRGSTTSMAGSAARLPKRWCRAVRCRSSWSASPTPSPSPAIYEKLLAKYGLSAENIVARAIAVLKRKKIDARKSLRRRGRGGAENAETSKSAPRKPWLSSATLCVSAISALKAVRFKKSGQPASALPAPESRRKQCPSSPPT